MAAETLKHGPVHTLDLAHAVLGLSDDAGAASAAVFTLLGSDQRFEVDSEGCWTLCGPTCAARAARLPKGSNSSLLDIGTRG